jgi:uncharacterized protein (DUF3084 family)
MDPTDNAQYRSQSLSRIAADLARCRRKVDGLRSCIAHWERQISDRQGYIRFREDWIAGAQSQIDLLQGEIELLEEVQIRNGA